MHLKLLILAFGLAILVPGVLAMIFEEGSMFAATSLRTVPYGATGTTSTATETTTSDSTGTTDTTTSDTATTTTEDPTATTDIIIPIVPTPTYPIEMMVAQFYNDTRCKEPNEFAHHFDDWITNLCIVFKYDFSTFKGIQVVSVNETYIRNDSLRMFKEDLCKGNYEVQPLTDTCNDISAYKSMRIITKWNDSSVASPLGHITLPALLSRDKDSPARPKAESKSMTKSSIVTTTLTTGGATSATTTETATTTIGDIGTPVSTSPVEIARLLLYKDAKCNEVKDEHEEYILYDSSANRCIAGMDGMQSFRVIGYDKSYMRANSLRTISNTICHGQWTVQPLTGACVDFTNYKSFTVAINFTKLEVPGQHPPAGANNLLALSFPSNDKDEDFLGPLRPRADDTDSNPAISTSLATHTTKDISTASTTDVDAVIVKIQFYHDPECAYTKGPARSFTSADIGRCFDFSKNGRGAKGLRVVEMHAPIKHNSIRSFFTADCSGTWWVEPISGGCSDVSQLSGLKIVVW